MTGKYEREARRSICYCGDICMRLTAYVSEGCPFRIRLIKPASRSKKQGNVGLGCDFGDTVVF